MKELEAVIQQLVEKGVRYDTAAQDFEKSYINRVLERELSGYRFIKGELAPITDPAEIAAVESAASIYVGSGW